MSELFRYPPEQIHALDILEFEGYPFIHLLKMMSLKHNFLVDNYASFGDVCADSDVFADLLFTVLLGEASTEDERAQIADFFNGLDFEFSKMNNGIFDKQARMVERVACRAEEFSLD